MLLFVLGNSLCIFFWLKTGYKDPDRIDDDFCWCGLSCLSVEDWFGDFRVWSMFIGQMLNKLVLITFCIKVKTSIKYLYLGHP